MNRTLLLLSFCLLIGPLAAAASVPAPPDWRTPFEKSKGNTTATYQECIDYYARLEAAFPGLVAMKVAGKSDIGKPLHLVVLSNDGNFEPQPAGSRSKAVLLIQNGIHPGEPEGIDASMALARDLVQSAKLKPLLDKVTVLIIPIYNVDGSLQRNSTTRANQLGPESYGFRGNARNLDLNRDYIKLDSRNARSFVQLFQTWQPDLFVDTHTSNGADYQYTMTLIATQKDKLHPRLSAYLQEQLLPALYGSMQKKKWEMTPYVDAVKETPDHGLAAFLETPRYSTGYAALFNTIGFTTETHMLKPFDKRVQAQYAFLQTLLEQAGQQAAALAGARQQALQQTLSQPAFALSYKLDTTQKETISFRGYEAKHRKSDVSGLERLYYDRNAPYTKPIPYFNTYTPTLTVQAPKAYIIPQAWGEVVERLQLNGVQVKRFTKETKLRVQRYQITHFTSPQRPYEGHYPHAQVQVSTENPTLTFYPGDVVVYLNQPANRFVVETLEPQATDSYFTWNFFDGILQQKEWFSDYVFEDLAADLLRKNPSLEEALEKKKAEDAAFAKDAWAQLYYLYQKSEYFEPNFQRYPVVRLLEDVKLPLE